MTHLPARPTTEADATNALDRIDRLLDRIDHLSLQALARITSKESPPDDQQP